MDAYDELDKITRSWYTSGLVDNMDAYHELHMSGTPLLRDAKLC